MNNRKPIWILPVIVFAQFAGTSLWFAGNAVLLDLEKILYTTKPVLGLLTSSVQFGFIIGTLVFAFLSIADRYQSKKVFLISSLLAALFNASILVFNSSLNEVLLCRFLTGFFLAGIYPVGMKIAANMYPDKIGKAIGYLVSALVLGTAFPHLLNVFNGILNWKDLMLIVSILASIGGFILFMVIPTKKANATKIKFKLNTLPKLFTNKDFRAAALGYFGHMWELYAFWAIVPLLLAYYNTITDYQVNISLWSFIIISIGSLGCILGGYASLKLGSIKVAFFQLSASTICCIISPCLILLPPIPFIIVLIIWGFFVIGDSPQFSALTAKTAPKEYMGTGLTIVNSIGFAITIISIQLSSYMMNNGLEKYSLIILAIGPIIGLLSVRKLLTRNDL